MTAPDMVSVIAAAIKAHPGATTKPGTNEWHCNGCGDMIHSGRMSRASENLDTHQARAVLDAINEAGAVADPEVCGHALDSQGAEFGPKSPCTKPTGHDQYHRDNTGVAFGPYQGDPNE